MAESRFRLIARLAWRNIFRNRRSGALTIGIIATGLAGVSLLDGFIRSVETELKNGYIHRAMIGHVEIYHRGGLDKISEEPWKYALSIDEQRFVEDAIKGDPSVVTRVRFLELTGMVSSNQHATFARGVGYDVHEGTLVRGEQWGWNAYAGKTLDESGMLLGKGLGRYLGCETSTGSDHNRTLKCARPTAQVSVLTERGQLNAMEFPVTGLIDAGIREVDDHYINLSLAVAQSLLDTKLISYESILLKNENEIPGFISNLNERAQKAGMAIEAFPWSRDPSAQAMQKGIEILRVFKSIFLSVVICVAVMAVLNLMAKSIAERVREIGTLRAIGFYRRDLGRLLAFEGLFLGAIGSAIGFILLLIVGGILTTLKLSYRGGVLSTPLPLRVSWTPLPWLLDAIVFILLCAFTAMIVARKTASLSPAEALSSVER
jgi:putative ABC transport system permease protein